MAINGSSAMDQTACKLVPVPAQKLPEFNLSPQVRGRKRAACVSRPVCIGCIICTRADPVPPARLRAKFPVSWNLLLEAPPNPERPCSTRMPKQIFRPADRVWIRRISSKYSAAGHQRGFRDPRRCNAVRKGKRYEVRPVASSTRRIIVSPFLRARREN